MGVFGGLGVVNLAGRDSAYHNSGLERVGRALLAFRASRHLVSGPGRFFGRRGLRLRPQIRAAVNQRGCSALGTPYRTGFPKQHRLVGELAIL
jgi:hypothetical protein